MSTRTNPPGGSAYLTWNGITCKQRDDWDVEDKSTRFKTMSNTLGQLDERTADILTLIKFQPIAFASSIAALFAALVPYYDPANQLGAWIFPGTDLPAVIQQKDGKSITFPAAAITKMPALTFAPDKPLFGACELTALLAAGAIPGAAASHDTVATSAYTEPALNAADQLYDRYSLTLGTGGGALVVDTDKDGIVFTPSAKLGASKPAMSTTQNYRIEEIAGTIEFTPRNIDVDTFYSTFFPQQGANVALGAPINAIGQQLVIAGSAAGKAKLTIPMVTPSPGGGPQFSNKADKLRIKKVKLDAVLNYNSGWQPLFTLGTV